MKDARRYAIKVVFRWSQCTDVHGLPSLYKWHDAGVQVCDDEWVQKAPCYKRRLLSGTKGGCRPGYEPAGYAP